jgi:hypothetical protein
VRSPKRESAVRAVLTDAGLANGDALTFVEADLTRDAGWADALSGCDFALDVASPVHTENVKDEDDVIVPAPERCAACAALRTGRWCRAGRADLGLPCRRLRLSAYR